MSQHGLFISHTSIRFPLANGHRSYPREDDCDENEERKGKMEVYDDDEEEEEEKEEKEKEEEEDCDDYDGRYQAIFAAGG